MLTPVSRCSLMSLACRSVRNSLQLGGACLLMRSKSDLQSVVIMAWEVCGSLDNDCCTESGGCDELESSLDGMAANAGGNLSRVSSAICHLQLPSRIHAQYSLIHDKTSTAPANDMASADNVLTTTFWIFFECHTIGLTAQFWLAAIFLWLAMISIPWCESGTFTDANEASEKATKRRSSSGMGWILILTSANILASWSILFPSVNVDTRLCWFGIATIRAENTSLGVCDRQHIGVILWELSATVFHPQWQADVVSFFFPWRFELEVCLWYSVPG